MKKRVPYYEDRYRPQFHYTAESQIINDPNGLVYFKGKYHLMHQYNVHNYIYWGHAVSEDLVHWEHLTPALAPDEIGQIWSGSAVVDWKNTSGLQTGENPVFIAIFTYNEHIDCQQSQGIAYSNDEGNTWSKYCNNPVLTSGGKKDFRDPKVFWYAEKNCWIMVLACGDHVEFYQSVNLLAWEYAGEFGKGQGSRRGIWECPDLFWMPIVSKEEGRWILTVSLNDGSPAGGCGMQYFVGSFDGNHYVNENVPDCVLWMDYGQDFYAGVSWNMDGAQASDAGQRRLMIAWADNWLYRDELPTELFRGQLSTVRELTLCREPEGIRLRQAPVEELERIRKERIPLRTGRIDSGESIQLEKSTGTLDLNLHTRMMENTGEVQVRLVWEQGENVTIGYQIPEKILYVDRGYLEIKPKECFYDRQSVRLELSQEQLELRILADTSQLEIFADGGRCVITDLMFPKQDAEYTVEICAKDSNIEILTADAWKLETVWKSAKEQKTQMPEYTEIAVGKWVETLHGLEGDCEGRGMLLSETEYRTLKLQIGIRIRSCGKKNIAGLVFGYREPGEGMVIKLDADRKKIMCCRGGQILAQCDFQINTGRLYQVELQVTEEKMILRLDQVKMLEYEMAEIPEGRIGLYVEESVADFLEGITSL